MPDFLKEATETPPELMTVKETSEYMGIPLPTIYYLVQRGQLPAVQIGGRWRVKRSGLDKKLRIVTLSADLTLQPTINHSTFNDNGAGIFTRPGHERDKNTDIFVTGEAEHDTTKLQLSEDFAGSVIHVLDGDVLPKNNGQHFHTSIHNLPATVQAVAQLIKQNGHK